MLREAGFKTIADFGRIILCQFQENEKYRLVLRANKGFETPFKVWEVKSQFRVTKVQKKPLKLSSGAWYFQAGTSTGLGYG